MSLKLASFEATISFNGETQSVEVSTSTTAGDLFEKVRHLFHLDPEEHAIKILYKGKMLRADDASIVFKEIPSKVPKLIVMASSQSAVEQVQSKRSDPTIRGFENTAKSTVKTMKQYGEQDKIHDTNLSNLKSAHGTPSESGRRINSRTHPGIVAIMRERQLVVNLLGEMDPIDDRLMQKKQEHGACLLGYNTNHGLAIHIRLRTMDLQGFMPYPQLVATLIHELSHNWVGEHDLLFWGNFAQMRVEYLHTHARLAAEGYISQGKSTAVIAGVSKECQNGLAGIADAVMKELAGEMPQYGLSPVPLRQAIVDRCRQLTEQFESMEQGRKLGGSELRQDARRAALEAAEKRARDSSQNQDKR